MRAQGGTATSTYTLRDVGGPFHVCFRGTGGKRSQVGIYGAAVDPEDPALDVVGDADPYEDLWSSCGPGLRRARGAHPRVSTSTGAPAERVLALATTQLMTRRTSTRRRRQSSPSRACRSRRSGRALPRADPRRTSRSSSCRRPRCPRTSRTPSRRSPAPGRPPRTPGAARTRETPTAWPPTRGRDELTGVLPVADALSRIAVHAVAGLPVPDDALLDTRAHVRPRLVGGSLVLDVQRPAAVAGAVRVPGAARLLPRPLTPLRASGQGRRSVLRVEVLSSDRGDDLVREMSRHARAGLPQYWVLDPWEPSLRSYALDDGADRQVGAVTGRGGAAGWPGLVLDVDALLAD